MRKNSLFVCGKEVNLFGNELFKPIELLCHRVQQLGTIADWEAYVKIAAVTVIQKVMSKKKVLTFIYQKKKWSEYKPKKFYYWNVEVFIF